jgi:hypothetical protein
VADLIEQECGVKYHPAHVWRILQELVGAARGQLNGRWSVMKKDRAVEEKALA